MLVSLPPPELEPPRVALLSLPQEPTMSLNGQQLRATPSRYLAPARAFSPSAHTRAGNTVQYFHTLTVTRPAPPSPQA